MDVDATQVAVASRQRLDKTLGLGRTTADEHIVARANVREGASGTGPAKFGGDGHR
jgi:hypothetical protein